MKLQAVSRVMFTLYALLVAYVILTMVIGVGFTPVLTPISSLAAFGFVWANSLHRMGWKHAVLLFGATFLVSLTLESVGVATGLVYGKYHYSDMLGVKVFGLVPLLIPIAWINMSYPSFVIVQRILPRQKSLAIWRLSIAAAGAMAMTAWDLAMDPMMSAGGHWIWEEGGAYFGIPIQNFWGWWLTVFVSFVIFLWLARVSPESYADASPAQDRLAILTYALTGLSSILVDFRFGLAGAGLVGIFAMVPWAAMAWMKTNPRTNDEAVM